VSVTAPLRLIKAVRNRGRKQLDTLRTAAMILGRVVVMINESFGRVGEVHVAKKQHCAAGRAGGPVRTLLLVDTVICGAVAVFLPSPPFLVTCGQVGS